MDIGLVLSIAIILVTLALVLWRIYAKVSADGVITLGELIEGVEDAAEAIGEAIDEIDEATQKE